MQLRHLEIFHAIMVTGSITAAARLLNVSQPAATRLLLRAEDQLGYRLFDRIKGRLVPTREGEILHSESERLLGGLESFRRLARNLGAARSGQLRIAAAPALCIQLVPDAVARVLQRHPQVRFEVETRQYGDLLRAVLAQEVDIALGFDVPPHPALESSVLAEGRFHAIFPIAQARALPGVVRLQRFARQPFIGLHSADPLGAASSATLALGGARPDPIVEVKTNQVALALVARGVGAAIVDQYTAAAADFTAVAVRPLAQSVPYKIHMVRPRFGALSVLHRDFATALARSEKAIAARLPGGRGPAIT